MPISRVCMSIKNPQNGNPDPSVIATTLGTPRDIKSSVNNQRNRVGGTRARVRTYLCQWWLLR